MINDGQHRRAAIEKALVEDPSIGKETVAVVFFKDRGLKKKSANVCRSKSACDKTCY